MPKQMKGEKGDSTGSDVRKAIESAIKKGLTLEQIGEGSNRSASTISQIIAGDIKNPPEGLAAAIRKIKAPSK